jgi:Zn-dependent M28 family amino/carboxypeptidase
MFHSYNPVLGAFDNLSGVAIVLGIGKYLSENKDNCKIYPTHTRVHLISFAGEEAGLRGAKRYAKSHFDELKSSGTIVVNFDSISTKDKVIIVTKEPGIGAKHDQKVYNELLKIAKELKIDTLLGSLPFGATDAAVFSKKGIPATTISSLNLKEELKPYYHTRNDKPEVIDKEALWPIVEICSKYLKVIDANQ